MASNKYRKTFLIRFAAYLGNFIGVLALLFEFGPILSTELSFRMDELFGIQHTVASDTPSSTTLADSGDVIIPKSADFDIVIEKINANSKVIPQVDPTNESAYMAALQKGVAEAKGSTDPGQPGNLYIFSHSTDAPWDIVRYNAVFYLLRELVPGDRVIIFYNHQRYNYIVFDKHIVSPTDVSYLTNRYDKPVLTLQTCDPPGTTLNRLIVRAQLENS